MRIVHIATELFPVAKIGGLADVLYGLSKELIHCGHEVEVILPKYDCLHSEELKQLKVECKQLASWDKAHTHHYTIWSAILDRIKLLLIETDHPSSYFSRGVIYGCPDDIDRFVYFSKAAIDYLFKSKKQPHVIHTHDWPTALIPLLYKEVYIPLGYPLGGSVFTIHNMEHQGKCEPVCLTKIGLCAENDTCLNTIQDPHNPTLLNLLKAGIVYADQIITVSPTYQKEIQTIQGGFGLEETLITHKEKLTGILNGIDENFWDPEKDPYLFKTYRTSGVHTPVELQSVLAAKKQNKEHLRTCLNMEHQDKPLVVCVTRLVHQKSPQLIKHALFHTLQNQGQFVLLGSMANPVTKEEFMQLQQDLSSSDQARVLLDKDEALAHLLYAAADMFIIPSLFEPCGLTQMISLRYATVPIVRKTGGLADTVFDIDTSNQPLHERNGYTFDVADNQGVNWALDRALSCYINDRDRWHTLILNGIQRDLTWSHSVKNYLNTYELILRSPFLELPIRKTIVK